MQLNSACIPPALQAYQRHGFAQRLLDFVMRYAAETACRAVYLHVAGFNNAAISFYQRAGFRQMAVLPDFYTIRCCRCPC
jgi:ribosomal protein S18 acetylase RimI-like enzyme